jgi:alkylglycerol monooxygenase
MEAYAAALSYAIPGFILLVIIESVISRWKGMQVNRAMDTISSLSSGITNTLKSLMGLSIVILSYEWMVGHLALFQISSPVWLYILAFIGLDFAGYWSHRFNHEINLFWNRHIIHHSSEEFNLSCALRQSISAIVGIYFFLYIPMALIGIPAHVVAVVAPIHFFAQFWYHTRLIDKMGLLEYIIVTPSHHRVHHAINPEYIDKNYSEIFIVWDKLFGTFQEELVDVPAVYGVKRPVKTWNPVLINFMHLWQLMQDAWRTQNWWDKLRIWFMPTGWRPEDVKKAHPVSITGDVFSREKYDTEAGLGFKAWSWAQLTITVLIMYYLLVSIADISFSMVLLMALFLLVSIFAYTSLMDRHPWAPWFEGLKLIMGIYVLMQLDQWWVLEPWQQAAGILFGSYLAASFFMTLVFSLWKEAPQGKRQTVKG